MDNSPDSIDYMHPSCDDIYIPALCIGSPLYTSRRRCLAWHMLRYPVLGDDLSIIRAIRVEALWEDLQLHLARESTRRAPVQQSRGIFL